MTMPTNPPEADVAGLAHRLCLEERAHRDGLPGPRRAVADLMIAAADLIDRLTTEREAAETEIMWEVWQDDMLVASSTDEMDGRHYAAVYAQDVPVRFVRAETRRTPA